MEKELGGELIYLKAELHYLLVVTSRAQSLLLYNLKDAINELEEGGKSEGLHCHRSYWISVSQVKRLKKNGRQGILVMSNEEEVPVSRNQMAIAQEKFKINHG